MMFLLPLVFQLVLAWAQQCDIEPHTLWMVELPSAVYSTPVIGDVDLDGHRDVAVAAYSTAVDVLDGFSGTSLPGWPFLLPDSLFMASPLVTDINRDWTNEILVSTFDGFVVYLSSRAEPLLSHTLEIPPLRVERNWITDETGLLDRILQRPLVEEKSLKAKNIDKLFPDLPATNAPMPDDANSDTFVSVDAHIMCTPALGDVNGDGNEDLVIVVSYHFDTTQYKSAKAKAKIPQGVDPGGYAAVGVIVVNVATTEVVWSRLLALTRTNSDLAAYGFSSPTLVDMTGDGALDVVVGASTGKVFVLKGTDGSNVAGFPVSIGASVQAQVAAIDLYHKGKLNLVVVDMGGDVSVFDNTAKLLWKRTLSGTCSQSVGLADANADGTIDIVAAVSGDIKGGKIFYLDGKDGSTLPGFPVPLPERVMSPPLLLRTGHPDYEMYMGKKVVDQDAIPPPLIIVPCHDGRVYTIRPPMKSKTDNSRESCVAEWDVGEPSFTMVLADDVTGNGRMELLVSTMNGGVMMTETSLYYHPLRAHLAQQTCNQYSAVDREGSVGVYFDRDQSHEAVGSSFRLKFHIVDHRKLSDERGYHVEIAMGTSRPPLFSDTVTGVGEHFVDIQVPAVRAKTSLTLHMTADNGLTYCDTFTLGFHLSLYRWVKWILLLPLMGFGAVIFFGKNVSRLEETPNLGHY
eukprot:Rmarinus@m.13843